MAEGEGVGGREKTPIYQLREDPGFSGYESLDSSASLRSLTPRPVIKGLQLRLKEKDQSLGQYNYAPAFASGPFSEPVSWKLLEVDDVHSEHIRLHQLKKGDDLRTVVGDYRAAHAKAVVIINTENSLLLPQAMRSSLEDLGNYPVVVVEQSTGERLLAFFNNDEGDEVYARLETESQVDDDQFDDIEVLNDSVNTHRAMAGPQSNKDKGFGFRGFFGGSSKPVFDLKGEVRKLLFEGELMRQVTLDAGVFTMVMSNFSQYERGGSPSSNHVSELLKKFLKQLDRLFPDEFPFFLILAYRMYKHRTLYECDEYSVFVSRCIECFETLPPEQVSLTLKNFVAKKDYDIMYGMEEATISVFQLLGTACRELMSLSTRVKKGRSQMHLQASTALNRIVYHRILWISVHLKLMGEKALINRIGASKMWEDNLLRPQIRNTVDLTRDICGDFRLGLSVMQSLELPPELSLTVPEMGSFLASDTFIRPFQHVTGFIQSIEIFLKTGRELLVYFMTNLRAWYTPLLNSQNMTHIAKASVSGTILGAIEEGISYLDAMQELWNRRRWNKQPLDDDFRTECLQWLELLLGLVDVTTSSAPTLLKKFLFRRQGVLSDRTYRTFVTKMVVDDTKSKFSQLPFHLFYQLFKSSRIWHHEFLFEYLRQYKIPPGIRINDGTWEEFFSTVLERWQFLEVQMQMLSFVQTIASRYREENRADEFIPHLLELKVPGLFAGVSDEKTRDDKVSDVGQKFSTFLKGYIHQNNLRSAIMSQMQTILSRISNQPKHSFQWIMLNVLQSEMIPEFKALQGPEKNISSGVKSTLSLAVTILSTNRDWFSRLSPRQEFCWGVVSTCCSRIPVSAENFDWMDSYDYVIGQLGLIYNAYCNASKLRGHKCIITSEFPEAVKNCPSEDVRKYFVWVRRMQDVLCVWQGKFLNHQVNFDEMLLYANKQVFIGKISQAVQATSVLIDHGDVQQVKTIFMSSFDQLNCLLLRYVPGRPEVKWCTLTSLLAKHGVSFPAKIVETLNKHVQFPGEHKVLVGQLLQNPIHATAQASFRPGHEILLQLSKAVTLADLQKLLDELNTFLIPIVSYLEMLVFFHLYQSEMFEKHLVKRLEDASKPALPVPSPVIPERTFSILPSIMPSMRRDHLERKDKQESSGLSLELLGRALLGVKELLLKVIKGTATYADIIANGALQLESLDIEKEFTILSGFSEMVEMNQGKYDGLQGVRSMLELFQFTYHIQKIYSVCEQYGLTRCLEDKVLKELMQIVAELKPEGSRAKLTQTEALDKMKIIKQGLCLEGCKNYSCLDLFPAVADSAAFFQFIRDKQFVGARGQVLFREQYQLITAQLQHEEYDENVLNHLRAAYEFIVPFTEPNQTFSRLMKRVSKLDATHGLKQLETVNENINLINLWFSRAEGETIENVDNELENILKTGMYQFHLSSEVVAAEIFLVYQSSQRPRHIRRPTPTFPLEESGEEGAKVSFGTPIHPSPLPNNFGDGLQPLSIPTIEQRWNSEQISDFVRKLGFLDTEKEGGEVIKRFLHLNSTANKLLDLYMKLRELGHPHYQHFISESFPCKVSIAEADQKVADVEKQVLDWSKEVTTLRSKYSWLLFFSVPKLLLLYQMVKEANLDFDTDIDNVIREVAFLFENGKNARSTLRPIVKEALQGISKSLTHNTPENSPMEILGQFLTVVCSNADLSMFLLKQRCERRGSMSVPRPSPHLSITAPSTSGVGLGLYQLHYCPGYTHSQLLRLIIELYDGVPEAFELFHSRPTTSPEEICLFIERIKHHPLLYLVLEVNKLPFKLQELLLSLPDYTGDKSQGGDYRELSTVHFIETAPSVLREMPWITFKEHKESGPNLSFEEAGRKCRKLVSRAEDFNSIQLVYGNAGDGKTHYIRQQLVQSPAKLTIAVNEAFSPLNAIKKLRSLPSNVKDCAIFFNFAMMSYQVCAGLDKQEQIVYQELWETISWFFFDLLILGYVEDPVTGNSFHIPGGMEWSIYVEVPSLEISKHKPIESLHRFAQEIPALGLIGGGHLITSDMPYKVDKDVQLVCKYLKAYKAPQASKSIDRLYRETPLGYAPSMSSLMNKIIKFSLEEDISDAECHQLLMEYMPRHIKKSKIMQKLFIKYMKRRCSFLDSLPGFNYNTGVGEPVRDEHGLPVTDSRGQNIRTDTRHLGSTLMKTMLDEVANFCDPAIKSNWAGRPHQQLIYDFRDGGGSFGLLSLRPDQLREEDRRKFTKIGFQLHSMNKLQQREALDQYLARALGLPSEEGKRLTAIDDSNYVLTLDYTIKMLNIHERYECSVPVIIKGETGVGKTALVDMLSRLWSHSLLYMWDKERGILLDNIRSMLRSKVEDSLDTFQKCLETVEAISLGRNVTIDELVLLGQIPDAGSASGQFYSKLRDFLLSMADNPTLALLTMPVENRKKLKQDNSDLASEGQPLDRVFQLAQNSDTAEATARLLKAVLSARVRNTFYKLNVHAALHPSDIRKFFQPAFEQANLLESAYMNANPSKRTKIKMPFVTVFLDEVNTSSCLGLFKEIIVDRTMDGEPIPDNVFIVAACNPHRGNSMASHTWVRGSYYVRPLHPTLEFLQWDYGALDQNQERDYIRAKMQMLNQELPNIEVVTLTDLIVESQSLMRRYAQRQLGDQGMKPEEAEVSSFSCVSQRDIQRVFTFYQWLMKIYSHKRQHGERSDYSRRALMVALGLVYYMRLNKDYRDAYREVMDNRTRLPNEVNFSQAFRDELDWFMSQVDLPTGIARTQALKENLFATIVCTVSHIPLIIVGAPGSSKTLSFNLSIANLRGPESKKEEFRNVSLFPSLDPHFYQCSRRTTSNEIQTVFSRAINRQRSHAKFSLPIYCVVFMDEAGLPEESHESLKVLHYHLDKQEVSFVAITNHVLDAAKTNRAVSLFRPEVSGDMEDLKVLAKGCLCSTPEQPPPQLQKDLDTIVRFCPAYSRLMKNKRYRKFFGLRDFIHFVNYLRRRRTQTLTPQLVMEALERNFNGVYWTREGESFQDVCNLFLGTMTTASGNPMTLADVPQRSILEVLHESLTDRPQRGGGENEVRYKLLIDPSEDNSVMRLLFSFEVLQRKSTRVYVCSDFPADGQLQKINTIAAIRHSAIEGHTVLMSQTDDIHESFYDLFNQRFRCIDDPEHGPRYYANIAIGAHLKPCRVHKDFQCVIVVQQSEIASTPAPFLNRFEKYCINHEMLLETAFACLPPCMTSLLKSAKEKVNDFIRVVEGDASLYGLKKETLDSLLLSILPSYTHKFKEVETHDFSDDVRVQLLQETVTALRNSAGFSIPMCSKDELESDGCHVFPQILCDTSFEGAMETMTTEIASAAVVEAMQVLHTAPERPINDSISMEVSVEACLVISLLQQWLIRHLCKRLMQLMTSEALTLHCKKIPATYIDNYLTHQQHFSLRQLVTLHHKVIDSCDGDTQQCASTKLLCFTRSSPLIHRLPTHYPSTVISQETVDLLSEVVFSELDKLALCKLSSIQTQSSIQELLRSFIRSPSQQVLLLLANMQEVGRDIINHLRVMMEEVEVQVQPGVRKLFVLLLHFPPSMFFDACYPSLFLRGWNHYYLDTIGHTPSLTPGVVNIEEWFERCCFPHREFDTDSLLTACKNLLKEAIPVLASRVIFGTRSNGPFTRSMKAVERCQKLRELLFRKGVGEKLCVLFRNCWKPHIMTEYLERAAAFTRSRESSLNITDTVQAIFQSSFVDFLVYVVTKINANRNLDILFDKTCSPATHELFLSLLDTFVPPKLSQVKTLAGSLTHPKPMDYQPHFPFYNMVYDAVQKLVEESQQELAQQKNLLGDLPSVGESLHSVPNDPNQSGVWQLAELIQHKLLQRMESDDAKRDPVCVVVQFMQKHKEMWDHYFTDFSQAVLHLDTSPSSSLSQRIISAFFSDVHLMSPHHRIGFLHAYVDFNQLMLANMASFLRPLEKIWKVAENAPHALTSSEPSQAATFVTAVEQTRNPFGRPEQLSQFILNTLFSALVGSVYPRQPQFQRGKAMVEDDDTDGLSYELLQVWYEAYRKVISLQALRVHLYMIPVAPTEEAKFNIMHATFLSAQIFPALTQEVLIHAGQVFTTLFCRYFEHSLKLREPDQVPQLQDTVLVTTETLLLSPHSTLVQRLLEGFLAHFFSKHRPSFVQQNIQWFLLLSNCQQEWRSSSQVLSESVISSSYSEDLLEVERSRISRRSPLRVDLPSSCISVSRCKMYLSCILGSYSQKPLDEPQMQWVGPMLMYDPVARMKLAEVLYSDDESSCPGPYIPTFYQECKAVQECKQAENLVMQQPLCHLYFLTLLEHLLAEPRELNSLVRLAGVVGQWCEFDHLTARHKLLLHIEKQAVIQVIIQQVAELFTQRNHVITNSLDPIITELNQILDEESSGGGAVGGHGLALAMHLNQQLQSARRFTHLLTHKYDALCKQIHCLQTFHHHVKMQKVVNKPYLFPFMLSVDHNSPLSKLYHHVLNAMMNIHQTQGSQEAIDQFLRIAEECNQQRPKITARAEDFYSRIDKRLAFRMMVWLVAYYQFFCERKASRALSEIVEHELMPYIREEGVVRIIQAFLLPKHLIQKPESPTPLREDAPVLEFLPTGGYQRIDHGERKVDPLYELFMPSTNGPPRDQSDSDLCHSLANLVAVVLGCQPQTNHLWYHLFSPMELKGTYIAGFMYDSKIHPEGLLYDCGVELTADGQYGRPDYIKHAARGTYTLHSLYLLLWANFGAFSMALLTQPMSQKKIHGPIISEWQAVRHYCLSQLRTVWMHMRNNLSLSDEERAFFTTQCLMNLYEVSSDPGTYMPGKLRTRDDLDSYERLWHERIYNPARDNLQKKMSQCSTFWQNKVFLDIRQLEACYPQFPTEQQFLHSVQSQKHDESLAIISRFALEKTRLEAGGKLLVDLIEFYQWLHVHMAHLVTHERAYSKLTIGRVVQLVSQKTWPYLAELYKKVKAGYKLYVDMVGGAIGQGACAALRRGNRVYQLDDDMPFIHFLSESEMEGEGNDWLFTVIADIAATQNLFVEMLYAMVEEGHKDKPHLLSRLLPKEPSYIYPTEASEHSCIIGNEKQYRGMSDFLQIIRSQVNVCHGSRIPDSSYQSSKKATRLMSITPEAMMSLLPSSVCFSLHELQEDIITAYLIGKPIINDVGSLRIPFKFRRDASTMDSSQHSDPVGVASDLQSICRQLPEQFKVPLMDGQGRRLEHEYHSANYQVLTEALIGLRNALGLLIKVLSAESRSSEVELKDQTLRQFMLSQYDFSEENSAKVFDEFGMKSLSQGQRAYLSSLKLCYLYSAVELFAQWVTDGMYDFSSLPMALKAHLSQEDTIALEQIPARFKGPKFKLLRELKGLGDILLHAEAHLVKVVNESSQHSLMQLLQHLNLIDSESLSCLIPKTVLVQHYVVLRMILRRLSASVQSNVATDADINAVGDNRHWVEIVDDLWTERFPHLRDEGPTYIDQELVYDPAKDNYYGFYHGDDEEETDDKLQLMDELNRDPSYDRLPVVNEDFESMQYYDSMLVDSHSIAESELSTLPEGGATKAVIPSDLSIATTTSTQIEEVSLGTTSSMRTLSPSSPWEELSVQETIRQGLQDPQVREEVMMLISRRKANETLQQRAEACTTEWITAFLRRIGMEKHADEFAEEEVTGSFLLSASRETYNDLGVTSLVEWAKIAVLFVRELQPDIPPSITLEEVLQVLQSHPKLKQYVKNISQAKLDGEMLVYAMNQNLLDPLLKEIGIEKAIHCTHIVTAFKRMCVEDRGVLSSVMLGRSTTI